MTPCTTDLVFAGTSTDPRDHGTGPGKGVFAATLILDITAACNPAKTGFRCPEIERCVNVR